MSTDKLCKLSVFINSSMQTIVLLLLLNLVSGFQFFTLSLGSKMRPLESDEGYSLCDGDCSVLEKYECSSLDGPRCGALNEAHEKPLASDLSALFGEWTD